MQPSSSSAAPAADGAAAAAVVAPLRLDRRDLLRYLGNRVRFALDDHSILTGRLLSVSVAGNVILADAERERTRKRRRGESPSAAPAVLREAYASCIFLRGASIMAISYTSGVTTDKNVISRVGARAEHASRSLEFANASPAVNL